MGLIDLNIDHHLLTAQKEEQPDIFLLIEGYSTIYEMILPKDPQT